MGVLNNNKKSKSGSPKRAAQKVKHYAVLNTKGQAAATEVEEVEEVFSLVKT